MFLLASGESCCLLLSVLVCLFVSLQTASSSSSFFCVGTKQTVPLTKWHCYATQRKQLHPLPLSRRGDLLSSLSCCCGLLQRIEGGHQAMPLSTREEASSLSSLTLAVFSKTKNRQTKITPTRCPAVATAFLVLHHKSLGHIQSPCLAHSGVGSSSSPPPAFWLFPSLHLLASEGERRCQLGLSGTAAAVRQGRRVSEHEEAAQTAWMKCSSSALNTTSGLPWRAEGEDVGGSEGRCVGMRGDRKHEGRTVAVLDWSHKSVDYLKAWRLQRLLVEKLLLNAPHKEEDMSASEERQERSGSATTIRERSKCSDPLDGYVILLQHKPVFTLGQLGDESNLKSLSSCRLRTTEAAEKDIQRRLNSHSSNAPQSPQRALCQSQENIRRREAIDQLLTELDSSTSSWSSSSDTEEEDEFDKEETPEGRKLSADTWSSKSLCYRVERGGDVTFHGKGQLVLYPILDLKRLRCADLHLYLRLLEETVIRALRDVGLRGERVEALTGVWLAGAKVAAVGVKVNRWITSHGLSLNVNVNLEEGFHKIVPCGIQHRNATSVHLHNRGRDDHVITANAFAPLLLRSFLSAFQLHLTKVCRTANDLTL